MFCSFLASRSRSASRLVLKPCAVAFERNIGLSVLGSIAIICLHFSVKGTILGRLPFSGWFMLTSFFSRSMSVHCTSMASPIRAAVSLRNCRTGARFFDAAAISWSTSISVGMKITFSCRRYVGGFHVCSMNFRYDVYCPTATFLVLFCQSSLLSSVFTSAGLLMLQYLESSASRLIVVVIVVGRLPSSFM